MGDGDNSGRRVEQEKDSQLQPLALPEYRIAMNSKAVDGYAMALVPTPVRVVATHFAIRPTYHGASWGEGAYLEAFVLDHMPTGYRIYGGPFGEGADQKTCEAFGKSLATLAVDWSRSEPGLLSGGKTPEVEAFIRRARELAEGQTPMVLRWGESEPTKLDGYCPHGVALMTDDICDECDVMTQEEADDARG